MEQCWNDHSGESIGGETMWQYILVHIHNDGETLFYKTRKFRFHLDSEGWRGGQLQIYFDTQSNHN